MTNVYQMSEIESSLVDIIENIDIVRKASHHDFFLRINQSKIESVSLIQTFFAIKFHNELTQKIYEMMLAHATYAEKISSGGFLLCLNRICDYYVADKKSVSMIESLNPDKSTLLAIIDDFSKNVSHEIKSSIKTAINYAGLSGKIVVERSQSEFLSVELKRGYTFNVQPSFQANSKFESPRIFCIDGYVESVSELEHIFSSVFDSKESAILFTRGLSNDIVHTLKVNYDRHTLSIIPVVVNFDLSGINTINDIAIVCGCDLVSSNKGELISQIKLETSPKIQSITFNKTNVVIINKSTNKSVSSHVSMLRNKRSESDSPDVHKLIDDRIRTLTSNHVIVRIPDDKDFVRNSQMIDYVLRATRSALDYGVTSECNLYATSLISAIEAQKCCDLISQIGNGVICLKTS